MNNCVGKNVRHVFFGKGVVTEQDGTTLTVKFANKTIRFSPESFERKFICFEDSALQEEMLAFIKQEKDAREAELDAVIAEMNEQRIAESKAKSNKVNIGEQLSPMEQITDAAHKLYDACCEAYGWNAEKRGFFCKQKSLYAADVTPEHYGVWCLGNSNWTGTKNGKWKNTISSDCETISTKWDSIVPEFYSDDGELVVFAKNENNMYVFLGIYTCSDIDVDTRTKTYTRTSLTYVPVKISDISFAA